MWEKIRKISLQMADFCNLRVLYFLAEKGVGRWRMLHQRPTSVPLENAGTHLVAVYLTTARSANKHDENAM
jgi:hypothetical protein